MIGGFIEQLGGYFLDSVAMGDELRLPRDAWRPFYLCESHPSRRR